MEINPGIAVPEFNPSHSALTQAMHVGDPIMEKLRAFNIIIFELSLDSCDPEETRLGCDSMDAPSVLRLPRKSVLSKLRPSQSLNLIGVLPSAIPIPDLLFGTALPSKTKPPQEDIAAEKVLPDEQSSPEQTRPSPPSPIPPPLRSADSEDNEEKETMSEHSDRPVHESVIKAEDADESEATEVEPAAGDDDWDNEDTLVEIVAPGSLKEEAFKIAEGLCPETSIAKAKGLEVLGSEVPPAAPVVAQA